MKSCGVRSNDNCCKTGITRFEWQSGILSVMGMFQQLRNGESIQYAAEGVRMRTSTQVIFWIMGAFGYLGSPTILIWGWARWLRQPKPRTVLAILSMIGFVLATASAVLAVSSIIFAQFHHFPYYDPLLLRIFRTGTLLSLAGIAFGVSGAWRATSLR